jgi:hypothetical protein
MVTYVVVVVVVMISTQMLNSKMRFSNLTIKNNAQRKWLDLVFDVSFMT